MTPRTLIAVLSLSVLAASCLSGFPARAAGECVPESNVLQLTYDTLTQPQRLVVKETLDEYLPKIRSLLGPPLFNIKVAIVPYLGSETYFGRYDPLTRKIEINFKRHFYNLNDPQRKFHLKYTLIHELGHAWRHTKGAGVLNAIVDEGLSEVVSAHFLGMILDPNSPTSTWRYGVPNYEQMNEMESFSDTILFYSLSPYRLGATLFGKLMMSNPTVLKGIHCQLNKGFQSVKQLILDGFDPTRTMTIEGKKLIDWINAQRVLNASGVSTGTFLFPNFYGTMSIFRGLKVTKTSPNLEGSPIDFKITVEVRAMPNQRLVHKVYCYSVNAEVDLDACLQNGSRWLMTPITYMGPAKFIIQQNDQMTRYRFHHVVLLDKNDSAKNRLFADPVIRGSIPDGTKILFVNADNGQRYRGYVRGNVIWDLPDEAIITASRLKVFYECPGRTPYLLRTVNKTLREFGRNFYIDNPPDPSQVCR